MWRVGGLVDIFIVVMMLWAANAMIQSRYTTDELVEGGSPSCEMAMREKSFVQAMLRSLRQARGQRGGLCGAFDFALDPSTPVAPIESLRARIGSVEDAIGSDFRAVGEDLIEALDKASRGGNGATR